MDEPRRDARMGPREAATRVAAVLTEAGHVAYFAGGCVRDQLLNLEPQDFDVATDAHPERVARLFPGARYVGEAFGVVLVRMGRRTLEVATFRSDGPYHDGRRPTNVTFASPEADAARRDFTVNGLFQDPRNGEVIDFVGGIADLRARVIRAIGSADARIAEDRLRTIRAVRFAARLDFAIESLTMAAIARAANDLRAVSRERVGAELRKMLSHPSRGRACQLLEESGLDASTLLESHVAAGTSVITALSPDANWTTALAAWRAGRRAWGAGSTDLRGALMLSNDEIEACLAAERCRGLLPGWLELPLAARIRAAALPGMVAALQLAAAEGLEQAARWAGEHEALAARPGGLAPNPLVTGSDLIQRGRRPSPDFKRILDAAYDRQLEGPITDREEALSALESVLRP